MSTCTLNFFDRSYLLWKQKVQVLLSLGQFLHTGTFIHSKVHSILNYQSHTKKKDLKSWKTGNRNITLLKKSRWKNASFFVWPQSIDSTSNATSCPMNFHVMVSSYEMISRKTWRSRFVWLKANSSGMTLSNPWMHINIVKKPRSIN